MSDTAKNENDEIKTADSSKNDKNVETGVNSDVLSIVDTIVETSPDVQQHAIDQHFEKEKAEKEEFAHLRDKNDKPFDPTRHQTKKDGTPSVSKLGKLILKPGRKKADSAIGSALGGIGAPATPEQKQSVSARAGGKAAANLLITIGIAAGGDEWQPTKDPSIGLDEQLMLETAFGDYFEATGRGDLPPGVALLTAIGFYALPRFRQPKTQSRINRLVSHIKKWWAKRKMKQLVKKGKRLVTEAEKKSDNDD